jgi:transglutaminase-like putative cysteine protease
MIIKRLLSLFLYASGLLLAAVGWYAQTWTLASFALLALLMGWQYGRLQPAARLPEDSWHLRRLAYLAQVIGMAGLAWGTALWWLFVPCALLLYGGHVLAYRTRQRQPLLLKLALFVGLHLVFVYMFIGMFGGAPYPQAQAAMLTLVVVSAAQRTRMNLYSAVGIGMACLYVAATLARDLSFLGFLAAFVAALLAFMWRSDDEDGLRENPLVLRPLRAADTPVRARWLRSYGVRAALALPLFAGAIFLVTPRFAGHPLVPPFTLNAPIRSGPSGQIINPAVPLVQVQGWSDGESDYYYGFDTRLDLSYRGGLSDELMMYVRSAAPSYWRSHAYDTYDGRTWALADDAVEMIRRRGPLFFLRDGFWREEQVFTQTYYIQRPMPNLIFTAGDPIQAYIAADQIGRDSSGGLRLGESLQPNMVYSIISVENRHDEATMRAANGTEYPTDIRRQYLQLPDTVTERTRTLARELSAGQATIYDVARTIEQYLKTTIPYDYFPPAQPPNTDAVDNFLFVDRRGVCEMYATSMVVMLRSLGIPARIVAGFGSGDFNAFTNLYEVRADDAHAWVEVWFEGVGWYPFDPTAGWNGDPQTGNVQRWVFSGALGALELPSIPTAEIASAGLSLLSALLPWLLLALSSAALGLGGRWLWRRWGRRTWQFALAERQRDPSRRAVLAAWRRALRRARVRGNPARTAQEQAHSLPALAPLADLVDIAAYRPQPPDAEEVRQVRH